MHCFMRTLNNNNNTKQTIIFKHTVAQSIKTQIKTLQNNRLINTHSTTFEKVFFILVKKTYMYTNTLLTYSDHLQKTYNSTSTLLYKKN